MTVKGWIAPRFERVRDVFAESLESGEDLGGACAALVDGEIVANLTGGWQDRKKTVPWQDDTIVTVYSTGKAVMALLIAREVSAGRLDYDTPVAAYWPEFAQGGKDKVTLAEALSHQAGLSGFVEAIDPALWLDWDGICAAIAAMTPLWTPGSANGYHPQTVGFIAGEVLRRVTGRMPGRILREDFSDPHDIQVFCGLTEAELARASAMTKPPSAPLLGAMNEIKQAAFLKPWSSPAGVSREVWAGAQIPGSNMHADAISLARLMSIFADGGRFEGAEMISPAVLEQAFRPRISGPDKVLPFDLTWAAGLMINTGHAYGPSPSALGHYGFGGSCVVIDPEARLAFAYTPNRMSPHLVADPRALALIEAVYDGL